MLEHILDDLSGRDLHNVENPSGFLRLDTKCLIYQETPKYLSIDTSQELLKILDKWGTSEPPSFTTPCITDQLDLSLTLNDFEINLMRVFIKAHIATVPQHQSKMQEDSAQFMARGTTLPAVTVDAVEVTQNRSFTALKCHNVVSGGKDHRPPPGKEAFPPSPPKRRYRGVYLRASGKFSSEISTPRLNNKRRGRYLGTFNTAEQAAMAFDQAALKFRGSDAVLNFPDLIGNHNVSPEKDNEKKLSPEGSPSSILPERSTNPQLFLPSQDQQQADIIKSSKKKSRTHLKHGTFEASREIVKYDQRWSHVPLMDAHIQPSKRPKTSNSKTYSDAHNNENFKDDDKVKRSTYSSYSRGHRESLLKIVSAFTKLSIVNFDELQRPPQKGKKPTSSSMGEHREKLLKIVSKFTKLSIVNIPQVDDSKRHQGKLKTENLRLMEAHIREKRKEKRFAVLSSGT